MPLQETTTFFIRDFSQKNLAYDFFAFMSNLTKLPFWTSQFGSNHLTRSFWLVFFTEPSWQQYNLSNDEKIYYLNVSFLKYENIN